MSLDFLEGAELAALVTYLEIRERPGDQLLPPSSLRLERRDMIAPEHYRTLFRTVGAPWLWFSRLVLSDGDLTAIVQHPGVALFVVRDEPGRDVGMVELDFRTPGECELAFVGLVPELAGRGHGRWLLGEALEHAWSPGIARVHVHTCSLDHPAALAAYRRAGFTPFKRAIERFADPRVAGVLPADAAPQIPLLGTPGRAARCA